MTDIQNSNLNALNINNLTSLEDDQCEITAKTIQSMGPGRYNLLNTNNDTCNDTNHNTILLNEVGVFSSPSRGNNQSSVGNNGCNVDDDTSLKRSIQTDKRYINQLQTRLISGGPYIRGKYNVDKETELFQSDDTYIEKACNHKSETDQKNISNHAFYPENTLTISSIQNPIHIIPEDNRSDWIRGGLPSREIMRNLDYNKRCGKK